MADQEKEFSIDEAAGIIRKDFHEKLAKYSKELEELVKREKAAKALVISHKHNPGSMVGSGTEDIPPGKANPKGTEKAEMTKSDLEEVEHGPTLTHFNAPHGKYEVHKDSDGHHVTYIPHEGKEQYLGAASSSLGAGLKVERHHASASKTAKAEELSKPAVSEAQRAAMGAAASGKSTLGIPKKVGEKFMAEDKGGKLPAKKSESCAKCGELHGKMAKCGEMTTKSELVDAKGNRSDNHTRPDAAPMPSKKPSKDQSPEDTGAGGQLKTVGPKALAERSKKAGMNKAQPPMAKPPSGVNMATKVPTSSPGMKKKAEELDKGVMADVIARQAKDMGAPAATENTPKMPSVAQHAARASEYADFMPAATGPAGSKLGLGSPKAVGVTRSATSAGPVRSAAKPEAAKRPGIFGKLFNK